MTSDLLKAPKRPMKNGPSETVEKKALDSIVQETIDEARMVLPGIQALFGFQLIAVFNQRFQVLGGAEQSIHYAALILTSVAIGLIMAPAAYHRIAEQTTVSEFLVKIASWLIAAAMVPLMASICFEVYIVGVLLYGRGLLALLVPSSLFLLFLVLWFVLPLLLKRKPDKGSSV